MAGSVLVKLLGGFIIILACGALGNLVAKALAARAATLSAACHGLQLLATEIDYGATPLPLALTQVSQRLDGEVGLVFAKAALCLTAEKGLTAAEAWSKALESCLARLSMNGGDADILRRFGQGLGLSHREDQLRRLHLAAEQLEERQKEAAQTAHSQGRIWRGLGISTGLVLFLMWL